MPEPDAEAREDEQEMIDPYPPGCVDVVEVGAAIGDVPPAEYESDYYRQREESAMAA